MRVLDPNAYDVPAICEAARMIKALNGPEPHDDEEYKNAMKSHEMLMAARLLEDIVSGIE